jgi:hypothetical protein
MLRLSRPLTLALLWLAIALLPIRGWAAVVMPSAALAHSAVAAFATMDDGAEQASVMPCHEAAVADGSVSGEHTCSMCDVCHSVAAPVPGALTALLHLPDTGPRIEPAPGIERPVHSGPERPPRITLA